MSSSRPRKPEGSLPVRFCAQNKMALKKLTYHIIKYLILPAESAPAEADESVSEDEDDSTDLQVKSEDELPDSSHSQ